MKKLFLSVCLIMVVSYSFAQKGNVSKAEGLISQETPDFKAARAAIQAALKDSTTKNDAKTYYIAGLIGEKENSDLYGKATIKMKIDSIQKGRAIMESFKYYLIADSLDKLPDAKGKVKPKYSKKIAETIKGYYTDTHNLFDYAAYLYQGKRDFKGALEVFNAYLSIPSLPIMSTEKLLVDGNAKYYAAYAARSIEDHDTAIKYYTELKSDSIRTNDVYQLLSTEYLAKKDTVNYVNTLKEGFSKFKDEPWYLQNIINHYIFSNQIEKASKYLDDAIAQSPEKAEYYAVKGNIEDKLGHVDVARTAFDKALSLDPNSADAYAGIGRIIFNKGVEVTNNANNIKDNKLYKVEKEKADAIFKEAMPYLQKAVELKPKDYDNKFALKQLYYRLDMQKEYDEITKEMNQQ